MGLLLLRGFGGIGSVSHQIIVYVVANCRRWSNARPCAQAGMVCRLSIVAGRPPSQPDGGSLINTPIIAGRRMPWLRIITRRCRVVRLRIVRLRRVIDRRCQAGRATFAKLGPDGGDADPGSADVTGHSLRRFCVLSSRFNYDVGAFCRRLALGGPHQFIRRGVRISMRS